MLANNQNGYVARPPMVQYEPVQVVPPAFISVGPQIDAPDLNMIQCEVPGCARYFANQNDYKYVSTYFVLLPILT